MRFREGWSGLPASTLSMNIRLWGLAFSLCLGCAGKNTVAGSDKTQAEQLEEAVPSWCVSICQRLAACSSDNGCHCSGDGCECAGVSDNCARDCEQEMERYTAHGDEECAGVGLRFKSCIDRLSCEQFNDKQSCALSASDERLCPDDVDEPPSTCEPNCDVPPSGTGGFTGGPSGSAGSAAAGGDTASGTAGTSSGGASSGGSGPAQGGASGGTGSGGAGSGGASGGPPVDCSAGYGSAGSSAGGSPSSLTCEEGRDACSDGHSYNWVCVQGSQGQTGCTCFLDSQVTGGFDPGSASCPTLATVNSGCGWNITQ
jgi:hypothetical protein